MTRRTSYDVQIGGVPYLVVKDDTSTSPTGAPAVQLGSAPEEPGTPGEITTIRFDAFHHGPGGAIDRGEGKYARSTLDTSVPGALYPLGDYSSHSYPTADLGLTDFLGGVFRDVSGVAADYDALVLAFSPGCYWRMGEASGNLADSAPTPDNDIATKHGSPTYGVTGAIAGDADKAISLAGNAADYFEVANSASVDTGDVFSIVAWIKKAANGSLMTIAARPAQGFELDIDTANKLHLAKSWSGTVALSTTTITDTNWHQVAATKNGATVHLYIDSVDVTDPVNPSTVIVANHGVIQIGRHPVAADYPWNGSLDEIAVFPTALTAASITALYNAGIGSVVPGLDTYVFFILPKGVLRYIPTTGVVSLVKAPPANFYFTGSRAQFQGKWWLGVEGADRVSGHMVTYTPAAGSWADTTVHGSHVFSAKNKMWWAENKGVTTSPELNWSEVADLSTPVGPYPLDTGGFVTWLHTLGPWVLVMKQDGNVYGVDEDGVWVPVIKGNSLYRSDPLFGHGTLEFQGRLLIPGYGQLLCVDSSSLQTTDLHPSRVQRGSVVPITQVDSRPIIARMDDTIVAWVAGVLWRLDEYPEGISWNVLDEGGTALLLTQAMIQDPLSILDNRLLYVFGFPALDDTAVFSICLPSADHILAPTSIAEDGYVTSQKNGGEGLASGVSKRPARVRGWAQAAGWKVYVGTDIGTAILCGTTTAEGPYAFDIPATVAIGRYVFVKPVSPTTASWTYLSLPIYVDCYAVPSVTDDMTITILASQEQLHNQGGAWLRRNSKDIYDALNALVGTSTTLLWGSPWNGTLWTVLVLAVSMVPLEGPARTEGQEGVKVFLRRL
jgi:hypothetical protein